MTLLELKKGIVAIVSGLNGDRQTKMRMDGFGLRKGKKIKLIRTAPFSGPLLVEDVVSGARMMISREAAAAVEVTGNDEKS